MGTAKDCCHSALRCIDMAKNATDLRLQTILLELAKSWMELARTRDLADSVSLSEDTEDVAIVSSKH
jgi:hypothetical protein